MESKVDTLINYMKDKKEDDVVKTKVMEELNEFDIEHFMRKLLKMEQKISFFSKMKDSLTHMNQIEAKLNDNVHQTQLIKQDLAQKNALNKERFQKEGENTSLVFSQLFEQIRAINDKIGHHSSNSNGNGDNNNVSSLLNGLPNYPQKTASKKEMTLLRSEIAEAKGDLELMLNEQLSKMKEYIQDEVKFGVSNASFNSKIKSKRKIEKNAGIENQKMSVVLEQSQAKEQSNIYLEPKIDVK